MCVCVMLIAWWFQIYGPSQRHDIYNSTEVRHLPGDVVCWCVRDHYGPSRGTGLDKELLSCCYIDWRERDLMYSGDLWK